MQLNILTFISKTLSHSVSAKIAQKRLPGGSKLSPVAGEHLSLVLDFLTLLPNALDVHLIVIGIAYNMNIWTHYSEQFVPGLSFPSSFIISALGVLWIVLGYICRALFLKFYFPYHIYITKETLPVGIGAPNRQRGAPAHFFLRGTSEERKKPRPR